MDRALARSELLTRRSLLRRAGVLLAGASVASLLAACGGGGGGAAPAKPAAEPTKPGAAPAAPAAPAASPAASPAAGAAPAASPAAAGAPAAAPAAAKSLSGELKILQWSHFVPAFDEWFDKFATDWGSKNNVKVTVDHIALAQLPARSASEVQAKSGHDIFGWFAQGGPWLYDENLVDLSDVVNEIGKKYGGWAPSAEALCNVNGKWKGMPDFLVPFCSLYRGDIFTAAGFPKGPDTWDDLLKGGAAAKKAGNPVGTALSNTSDGEMTWRSVLWSFGGKEVEKDGKTIALDSKETRAALDYAKALYEQAMTNEVLSWDDAANNQYLASGKGSWIYNPISAYRTIEKQNQDLFKNIQAGLPLAGPAGRFMSPQFTIYGVWNFSKNQDAAKEFLRAYKSTWPDSFKASEGYDVPFENDLFKQPMPVLGDDPKLKGIQDAGKYVQVIGYPGPNTVASNEVLDTHIIADMFTRVATGQQSADASIAEAIKAMQQVYNKRR